MAPRFIAVWREYPRKDSIHPLREGEELTVDGIVTVRLPNHSPEFWIYESPALKVGIFDSERDAQKVLLHERHGELATPLGVENALESVDDELRRHVESVENEGWSDLEPPPDNLFANDDD